MMPMVPPRVSSAQPTIRSPLSITKQYPSPQVYFSIHSRWICSLGNSDRGITPG